MRKTPWILAGLALAAIGGALGWLVGTRSWDAPVTAVPGPTEVSAPGPEYGPATDMAGARVPGVAFETLDGGTAKLTDLAGRVVVLNFWGTWCAPCRRELPELVDLGHAFADRGVAVVGIAIDSGEPSDIREFADTYGVDYEIWMSTTEVAITEFNAVGYPYTLLIDREGFIRNEYLGAQTLESLTPAIEALLE